MPENTAGRPRTRSRSSPVTRFRRLLIASIFEAKIRDRSCPPWLVLPRREWTTLGQKWPRYTRGHNPSSGLSATFSPDDRGRRDCASTFEICAPPRSTRSQSSASSPKLSVVVVPARQPDSHSASADNAESFAQNAGQVSVRVDTIPAEFVVEIPLGITSSFLLQQVTPFLRHATSRNHSGRKRYSLAPLLIDVRPKNLHGGGRTDLRQAFDADVPERNWIIVTCESKETTGAIFARVR